MTPEMLELTCKCGKFFPALKGSDVQLEGLCKECRAKKRTAKFLDVLDEMAKDE